jgi:Ca2+-binding RTX toxin-like protein
MTTINVSSTAALNLAVKAAKAGDTILLAPGAYTMAASNLSFASDVTISSADSTRPAVMTSFNINGSTGLTLSDLELRASATEGTYPFKVSGSNDIHFLRLDVHGSLDGNPQNDTSGFLVRDSQNVSFEGSEFHELYQAISHLGVDHLTVKANSFHDLRSDAVLGGGSNWVTITGNTFRDFFPKAGDHADAVQFWTTNTTENAHDIVVTDNVVQRGSGKVMQGVFFGDETDGLFYENVTITGNLVSGGMYSGISVNSARDVTVKNNIIQGFTDMKSWIRLDDVHGGTLSGNDANTYLLVGTTKNIVQTGNVAIPLASDGGTAVYTQWVAEHGSTPPPSPDSLVGGLALIGGVASDTLTGGDLGDTLSGGSGSDLLTGGDGDDLFITEGDAKVVEFADGGVDTVQSATSFTLMSNIENLEIVGSRNAWASGNGLDNRISGNAATNNLYGRGGADTLSGGAGGDVLSGGAGADELTGGAGVDRFVFTRGDGFDTVTDFGAGGEHDVLDLSGFYAAGLKSTLTETVDGVVVSFTSGDRILLEDVQLTNLHQTPEGYVF